MKIWLDDQYDEPKRPERHPPPGFIPVRNIAELKTLLDSNPEPIDVMDFDHDLADFDEDGNEWDGYMIIKWLAMERLERYPIRVRVHSKNPIGAKRILDYDGFVRRRLLP